MFIVWDCLFGSLFRRRSKKTSKLRATGLCAGNQPLNGEFPAHKWPVLRKMFPFDDIIMSIIWQFIQAEIKENIKAPRHWPVCGKFTSERWIPRTNGQYCGKYFHLMTSSCRACCLAKTSWFDWKLRSQFQGNFNQCFYFSLKLLHLKMLSIKLQSFYLGPVFWRATFTNMN